MLFSIPLELQLSIARRLDIRDRLALGCSCKGAAPLVVYVGIFEFKISTKMSEQFARLAEDEGELVALDKLQNGNNPACRSKGDRTKGHIVPMYEALDSAAETQVSVSGQIACAGDESPYCFPWPTFTSVGATKSLPLGSVLPMNQQLSQHHLLAAALFPDEVSLGLSISFLTTYPNPGADLLVWPLLAGAPPRVRPNTPRVTLKTSLVLLDLSRAQHLCSIAAAGLAALVEARLPPAARVACFDGCSALVTLRPTDGCTALQSLRMAGCRKLAAATFLDAAWHVAVIEELDLCWCTGVGASTLVALLHTATNMRSLSLRGLNLAGVLEALPAPLITAVDLGFSTGLDSEAVRAFASEHSALTRCNLRGATAVSAAVYNEVGQLAMARVAGASSTSVHESNVIENRRRPRHLAPREAAPFFYLKR